MAPQLGIRRKPIDWKNPEKLRKALGFRSVDEMKDYLTEPRGRFWPHFHAYAKMFVWPAQLAAAVSDKTQRGRGPALETVEAALLAGESYGNDKYSNSDVTGTDDFDQCDFLALMLLKLRRANSKGPDGLFFGKALSDITINDQLWALIKHAEANLAPARVTKTPVSQKTKLPSNQASTQSQNTGLGISGVPEASTTPQDSASDIAPPHYTRNPDEIHVDDDTPEVTPQSKQQPFAEVVRVGEAQIEFSDSDVEELPPVQEDDPNSRIGSSRPLTNAQRMAAECTSTTFDINYRFWVCWLLNQVLAKDVDWDKMKKEIEWATENLNHLADAETQQWFKDQIVFFNKDYIVYTKFDERSEAEFDAQQQYLDSESFQRDDVEDSCFLLGIPWYEEETIYRIQGMALSQQMRHWQVPAVKALYDFSQNPNIKGCILADVMGLGKTWVVVVYLLWLWNQRKFKTVYQDPNQAPRPTLYLMPKALINQSIRQIHLIAPNQFRIRKYHGDARRHRPLIGEQAIDGLLHKDHEIFDGRDDNANIIVISSYTTFAHRHGPRAQRDWRMQNGWTKSAAETAFLELDAEWPQNLSHCFNIAAYDECHWLKNLNAFGSYAGQWLKAPFNILFSGTPIPNGVDDFKGLIPFIEPSNSASWVTPQALQSMGVQANVNPFDLPDDHPAARLRLHSKYLDYYLFSSKWTSIEKGQRLMQCWKQCMIRRTHSSMIPFRSGKHIGDALPRIQAAFINCVLTDTEKTEYKKREDALTSKFLTSDSGRRKKAKMALGIFRKLTMLAMWFELPDLDEKYGLKSGHIKNTLSHDKYFLRWFGLSSGQDLDPKTRIKILRRMLAGSPRMRALLHNLKSQGVRDHEKAAVYCQLPATALYVYTVLKVAGIKAVLLASYMSEAEREEVVQTFTQSPDEAMVLVTVYSLGSTGLNLQFLCWRVHLLEPPYNLGITNQTIHRYRRIGNPRNIIQVIEYHVEGTFTNREVFRLIEKAIPECMAMLNRYIFGDIEAEDFDATIEIGEWIETSDGKLCPLHMAELEFGEIPHILSPSELIFNILLAAKGELVVVE